MDVDKTLLKSTNTFLSMRNMVFIGLNVQDAGNLLNLNSFLELYLLGLQFSDNVENGLP